MALRTIFPGSGDHTDDHGYLHAHYNNWMDVRDYGAVVDGDTGGIAFGFTVENAGPLYVTLTDALTDTVTITDV